MKTLTSITAPAARVELLDALSAFLAQLPNQIETAQALAAFHTQTKDRIEHTRPNLQRPRRFSRRLGKRALSGPGLPAHRNA